VTITLSNGAEHIAAELGKTALDERVLRAMAKVPRHEFVPVEVQSYAYLNRPIPIGFDKTISQPLMVAVMTDLLELKPDDVVLEIGTGLGYQSAVLAELASRVYSVEIIDELAQRGNTAAETTGLYQRRSPHGQRLCRLARARRPDCRNHLLSLFLKKFRVHETPHSSDTSRRCSRSRSPAPIRCGRPPFSHPRRDLVRSIGICLASPPIP
jgi:Protein-L-isoaspartate(D-aspartate) O-methyltransferase (PCMT)